MKKIFFFSKNKKKNLEISSLFKNYKIHILNLDNFDNVIEPEENGNTFEQNAKIKSIYGFNTFNITCFADDSGICISALENLPGVKSKRFVEQRGGYNKTFSYIINKTKEKSGFSAFFQSSISLTLSSKKTIVFNGIVRGRISSEPRGNSGFGYDPIFIPKGYSKTFAEITDKEKNLISHRAIAVEKLKKYLLELVL